ncbi:MAG: aldolase catalytic domain-containing protein [Lachnospiraceae bacterium]|nr:aldolase catalytic domain-containing protein [Lachnospiraceae bacterium]
MKKISLLDCTLRDGGFINDWNFGHGDIVNLFERSVSAGIDCIELGFLDEREDFDINRTICPGTMEMEKVFEGLSKGNSKLFAMIDFGTCGLSNIAPAEKTMLDGIRVMIKKKVRHEAIEFCRQLKEKGYLVGAQPVSVTGYSDSEMLELVKEINDLKPLVMYIVDTYGLLDRTKLLHIFELIDWNLSPDIAIGYHAHNNFQLAFSNSVALMERDTDRELIIDGSAFGIGKSAGNCPLELLTAYLNGHYGKKYHTSQILEMVDTGIMKIYEKHPWGYQMQYFLCASHDCHPKYPQYLLQKKTLSVKSVDEILAMIEPEKKLAFDRGHIEELYLSYQNNEINDAQSIRLLEKALEGNEVLVIGPGPSMGREEGKVLKYIAASKPIVMAINFVPEGYHLDYLFLSNSKRYMQLSTKLQEDRELLSKVIATSNVTPASGDFGYMVDYAALIDADFEIQDNSLPMLLKLLNKLKVKKAVLAGFDGYVPEMGKNYLKREMEYEFARDYALRLNDYTGGVIRGLRRDMEIVFLTESKYETQ